MILSELSKSNKALLEQLGYQKFVKQVENGAIIQKVDETVTVMPPDTSLFKEILKAIGNGEVEASRKIMVFHPTPPDSPPV